MDNDKLCQLLTACSKVDDHPHSQCDSQCTCLSATAKWTELFRFLRNCAAISTNKRNAIARNCVLLDMVTKRLLTLVDRLSMDAETASCNCELRCAIQFYGNLITNNERNRQIVWPLISSHFLVLLTCKDDSILVKYSSMLFYNCIIGSTTLRDEFLYSNPDVFKILSSLLRAASDLESEWGLYSIEFCLQSPPFMERCYSSLQSNQKIFVLDILIEHFSGKERDFEIPSTNLQFISQRFETKADLILKSTGSILNDETVEIVRIAQVLCTASSNHFYNKELANRSNLLCCTVFLLHCIQKAGKEFSNCFTPADNLSPIDVQTESGETEIPRNPIDGLKCNLIRLIANMSWQNQTNQDKVREYDGIPLLLDCCKLDAKNPYIIQWTIYAIRNLCEGNLENQKLIASMEKHRQLELPEINDTVGMH